MSSEIEEIRKSVSGIRHPEIDHDLGEIGMVGDIEKKGGGLRITVKVPFLRITIKEELVSKIKKAVKKAGGPSGVSISFAVMEKKEKERFMSMAKAAWIG